MTTDHDRFLTHNEPGQNAPAEEPVYCDFCDEEIVGADYIQWIPYRNWRAYHFCDSDCEQNYNERAAGCGR